MKILSKEKYLLFYYLIHYVAIFINFKILSLCFFVILLGFASGAEYNYPFFVTLKYIAIPLFISLGTIIYFVLTIISAIAINKIRQHKIVNMIEKFSAIIFPIIAIPLYSFLFYKEFVQYR